MASPTCATKLEPAVAKTDDDLAGREALAEADDLSTAGADGIAAAPIPKQLLRRHGTRKQRKKRHEKGGQGRSMIGRAFMPDESVRR